MWELFDWLMAYSSRASLLCVATLLILASMKRASASVRSGIILAGTLGAILLPMTVGILPQISLEGLFPGPVVESIPLEDITAVSRDHGELVGRQVTAEVLHNAGTPREPIDKDAGVPLWVTLLVGIWICGCGCSVVFLMLRLRSVFRLRSGSVKLVQGHPLVLEATEASASIGCGRAPDVRISDQVTVPSAIGLGLRTIILPVEFGNLAPASRRAVLIHECTHLRRRDSLVQLLIMISRCVHWFNPLFLALDRAFNLEAEKACDDQVIGMGISPQSYSETILAYFQAAASDSSGVLWNSSASGFYPCPQLDRQLRGRKKMILTRIRRMVDPAARRSRPGVFLGWALVGGASASASVLGALVLVPDYEWRYQLAERELPFSSQLVACWRMDEIRSGGTPESRHQSLFANVEGGTLDEQGRLDKAIYLDGEAFVDMGDRFGGLQFPITLTAWVRADTNPEYNSQNVVWLGGGEGDQYIYIGLNKGRPAIKSRNGEMAVVLGRPRMDDGEWHHLAGVFVSESRRLLYLDGELVAEDTRLAIKPPTLHLQVGRNGRKNAETSYIQGAVDDVRVYQADLDQVAVTEIMKGDFALVAARRRLERE